MAKPARTEAPGALNTEFLTVLATLAK